MSELLIVSALILAGFALIWVAKRCQLDLGEATKTTLIVAPLILFLFLSGKLSEFEGLGWKAKFRSIGAESIIKAAKTSELATTSEQLDPADFFNEAYWGFCRPYYLLTDKSAKSKDKPDELDKKATLHIATAIRNSIFAESSRRWSFLTRTESPSDSFPVTSFSSY